MTVTITSIRLKSIWYFFRLSYFGLTILRQTKKQHGFITLKNTGFGYLHYTMSSWQSEVDAKNFARSGAHLRAMRAAPEISSEVKIYTFHSEHLPGWRDAKALVKEKGKLISYN